ncbi:hypothetical protein SAMN04490357_0286 [Streptomyces misionensis]|uniref:Uncharacterized protein n=1 Tax=Streptomyces misionensis TaxID=67331 RepID=A0A1H4LW48_9ACTN|nr:hypothetical protein SAMN04490357_0286 [Streptomyces misionensis]
MPTTAGRPFALWRSRLVGKASSRMALVRKMWRAVPPKGSPGGPATAAEQGWTSTPVVGVKAQHSRAAPEVSA